MTIKTVHNQLERAKQYNYILVVALGIMTGLALYFGTVLLDEIEENTELVKVSNQVKELKRDLIKSKVEVISLKKEYTNVTAVYSRAIDEANDQMQSGLSILEQLQSDLENKNVRIIELK